MGVKDFINDIFQGDEEPPKFSDFTPAQIDMMIEYWMNQQAKLEEQMNNQLWEIDKEYEDYIRNAKVQYQARKSVILDKYKQELTRLQTLLNSLRLRRVPRRED